MFSIYMVLPCLFVGLLVGCGPAGGSDRVVKLPTPTAPPKQAEAPKKPPTEFTRSEIRIGETLIEQNQNPLEFRCSTILEISGELEYLPHTQTPRSGTVKACYVVIKQEKQIRVIAQNALLTFKENGPGKVSFTASLLLPKHPSSNYFLEVSAGSQNTTLVSKKLILRQ